MSEFAVYKALVSLLQDLELLLSSFDSIFQPHTKNWHRPFEKRQILNFYDELVSMEISFQDSSGKFDAERPFQKDQIQNFYNELVSMETSLQDSSGKFDARFISEFGDRILYVARGAASCLESELCEFIAWKQMFIETDSFRFLVKEWSERSWVYTSTRLANLDELKGQLDCINVLLKGRKSCHDTPEDLDDTIFTGRGKSNFFHSSSVSWKEDGKFVGHQKDFEAMLGCLTGQQPKMTVFSVIGMAGIGKTTLAKRLYDHPFVLHHFYVRAWVTVSQQYQEKEMLLGILGCLIVNLPTDIHERCCEELKEQVYKSLKGKRYLIILDDMWDKKAWNDLRTVFPDDKNGSRVILTSRIRDVAVHACQGTPPHCLSFLNELESWELLCSKILGNNSCPQELVHIGKKIANKCQGLPLTIVVVAGLLSKMNLTVTEWETVAHEVGSLAMKEQCQEILALSYNNLPCHLKACFLYTGVFPEDYDISVHKLTWLWIAEGFIRPRKLKTLEELAEGYLEELIARSLILVKKIRSDGRIKVCGIHDIVRDFCLRVSQEENFLQVVRAYEPVIEIDKLNVETHFKFEDFQIKPPENLYNSKCLAIHSNILKFMKHETSFPCTRSFFCFEKLGSTDLKGGLGPKFRLLNVLDVPQVQDLMQRLRFLSRSHFKYMEFALSDFTFISSWLSELNNLQTLIVDCEWDGCLPPEFWSMSELRHFQMKRSYRRGKFIWDPNSRAKKIPRSLASGSWMALVMKDNLPILKNLQSLTRIHPSSCTRKVFISMPNLKSLGILETEEDFHHHGWLRNLECLEKLEALKYVFSNPFVSPHSKPGHLPSQNVFPPNLTKLTLRGTSFPWEYMLEISKLPKLIVLKLSNYAFSGKVWKTTEGGFLLLRFLLIGSTDLETWETDSSHFPSLQHLVLRHCRSLKEIPISIGEAPLLEKIELHCCGDSAATSARQIQEEQQSSGNDGLTVCITER